jgi:hypothetical protein
MQVAKLIRIIRNKRGRRRRIRKRPSLQLHSGHVGCEQPTHVNNTRSVDKVNKYKMKNPKPKFPCSICKGDHFLRDFPSLPKVLEMWTYTSSSPVGHAGDIPSTSEVKVGKKKRIANFLAYYETVIITLTFILV